MAAGNFIPYRSFVLKTARQEFDFLGATIQALLANVGYTPNVATHDALDDVTANEIADAGYARQTLGGKTIAVDGSGRTVWDANDVDFGNAVTLAAKYMILFLSTGTPATSWLMGYVDLNDGVGSNVQSTSSDFDVGFNAAGIYRITP